MQKSSSFIELCGEGDFNVSSLRCYLEETMGMHGRKCYGIHYANKHCAFLNDEWIY